MLNIDNACVAACQEEAKEQPRHDDSFSRFRNRYSVFSEILTIGRADRGKEKDDEYEA